MERYHRIMSRIITVELILGGIYVLMEGVIQFIQGHCGKGIVCLTALLLTIFLLGFSLSIREVMRGIGIKW